MMMKRIRNRSLCSLDSRYIVEYHHAENPYRRGFYMKGSICIAALLALAFVSMAAAQTRLKADTPERFTLASKDEKKEFAIDLRQDELCDLSTDATDEMPLSVSLISPSGEALIKD